MAARRDSFSPCQPIEGPWYDQARYFDIAFQEDTRREVDFIEAAARRYGRIPLRRLLEPGCGSGRLVVECRRRGYQVAGFDLNPHALTYLRDRLKRRRRRAEIFQADMATFEVTGAFDLVFNLCNTFRHLLSEVSARAHIRRVADVLRPGGLFILGLHVLPTDASHESFERWSQTRGTTRVTTTLKVHQVFPRRRIEVLRVWLRAESARGCWRWRDMMPLRLYSARQLRDLLQREPRLELCDVFDFWYDLSQPLKLDNHIADVVLILRRR